MAHPEPDGREGHKYEQVRDVPRVERPPVVVCAQRGHANACQVAVGKEPVDAGCSCPAVRRVRCPFQPFSLSHETVQKQLPASRRMVSRAHAAGTQLRRGGPPRWVSKGGRAPALQRSDAPAKPWHGQNTTWHELRQSSSVLSPGQGQVRQVRGGERKTEATSVGVAQTALALPSVRGRSASGRSVTGCCVMRAAAVTSRVVPVRWGEEGPRAPPRKVGAAARQPDGSTRLCIP